MDMFGKLARFDTFTKSKEHTQVRTATGAVVSTASLAIMAVLLITEFAQYTTTRVEDHLMVDVSQGDRDFDISMEIDFPGLACNHADLRVEDSKGIAYEATRLHLVKTPLDASGNPVKGRAVATTGGSITPGCRIAGSLTVRKVAGNFHVAAGQAFGMADGHLAYQLSPHDFATFNASHTIKHLSFGPRYRGVVAPLDGTTVIHTRNMLQHQYHIKAVPTLIEPLHGAVIDTNQFTATDFINAPDNMGGAMVQPGVWFR